MTKGEREEDEDEDEDEEGGGGMGMVEMSCMERESTTETELPAAKAIRPEELKSADPKLLRLGGPGSMQSQESCGSDDGDDDVIVVVVVGVVTGAGLGVAIGDPAMEASP